ncbi:MAG: bifunctional glycosyltransferase/class I SAM-dependent methyltransferase [Candidatus Falkowbacteria bacterium]|nr:bifunctional glycosyltransferase/class I SAM-dependent methyltransferase [Candidatus Falkowbacteria bacterium]
MNDNKLVKISACLVVYNEELVIERCLKSIASVVDEIIVVHDGPCQDKTLEIAANYGAKIIIAPRTGEAEPIRCLSYEAAQGEWILQIDADEFLSPELQAALPNLIQDDSVDSFEFLWPLYDGKKYVSSNWPYKRCLFRRSAMSFLGLLHYVVDVEGSVKEVPILLEHRPNYNNYSWKIFVKKWVPWAKFQASLYLKDFSEIKKFNYSRDNWPRSIFLRRHWPLLIAVPDFFIVVLKNLYSGAYKEGLVAWRSAFMLGIFRIVIDWNIFLGKKKKTVKMPEIVCPCGGDTYTKYWYDTAGRNISILACKNCGLARTWPIPLQDNLLIEYYQARHDHEDRFDRLPEWEYFSGNTIKLLKKWKKTGNLLDVGCSLGVFVAEAKKYGFDSMGIDLSEGSLELGEKKLDLTGRLKLGTLAEQSYPDNYWDIITYVHCFEHIENLDLELKNIKRVIKPSGILLIEVPRFFSAWRLILGYKWYGFSPFQHIWQFGNKGLCSTLERNGFAVVKAYTRINMYHKASFNLRGLLKIIIKVISFITGTGDNLIVIALKR